MPDQTAATRMPDMYRFFSLSMRYPHPSWLTATYFITFFTLLGELGWDEEAAGLRSRFEADGDPLEPLRVEYTRLFINAIPHVVAPPFGSIYVNPDGVVYGANAVATKAFYREHGFELASETAIPDDLGCELEFLATLAEQGKTEAEKLFLRTLFRPWFPIFRDRVIGESLHPFYVVVVKLIDFFSLNP
ncbi:MAG: molecular chaperone TorD family protein [Desulfobacteraceae bacterium]|nr:molecular chaperone TorD family protein [Desulfobacteraceae bacterium]